MLRNLLRRVTSQFNPGSFRKYFLNTGWLIAEKILRIVAVVFVGAYVARYLGPQRFGMLSYADSFVALFLAFSTLGLDSILVRELVKKPESRDVLMGTTLFLRVFCSLISIGLIYGIIHFTESDTFAKSIILIISIGYLFKSFRCLEGYFQSQTQSKYILISSIIQLTVSSILKIYLVVTHASLLCFVYVVLLESALLAGALTFCYTKAKLSLVDWNFKSDVAVGLLKDSWPLILSIIAVMMNMKIDQIMINKMLNMAQVGIYAAAVRVSQLWFFVAIVVCDSLFPAILRAKENSVDLYFMRLRQLFKLLFWISLPITVLITIYAVPIINILFGSEYLKAAHVLRVHIWGTCLVYMGTVIGRYLIAENYTKVVLLRNIVGATVNIILNYIFITKYGILGAAWATILAYLAVIFVIVFIPKTRIIIDLMIKSLFSK